jgi:hypothetical protein
MDKNNKKEQRNNDNKKRTERQITSWAYEKREFAGSRFQRSRSGFSVGPEYEFTGSTEFTGEWFGEGPEFWFGYGEGPE